MQCFVRVTTLQVLFVLKSLRDRNHCDVLYNSPPVDGVGFLLL